MYTEGHIVLLHRLSLEVEIADVEEAKRLSTVSIYIDLL